MLLLVIALAVASLALVAGGLRAANAPRYLYGETWPVSPTFDTTQAVAVGDLSYLDSSTKKVLSASQFAWQGSTALTQAAFVKQFIGVAAQRYDGSNTGAYGLKDGKLRVDSDGVFLFSCTSATFKVGDLVGPDKAAGNALLPQQVVSVATTGLAIGRVVEEATSTTTVKVRIFAAYLSVFDSADQNVSGNLTLGGYLFESSTNAVTAFAGGGQASATALTTELNRVTVVATAADSVKLPASVAGLTILVENAAANPMQVFGAGTDTVNGVATATGVPQMPGSVVLYTCYAAGAWFTEGLGTGFSGALQTLSFTNAITAFATGGQASATALTTMISRVTVCATAGDSVKLPASAAGMCLVVSNDGAAGCDVFPATGDSVNGQAANVAVRLKPGYTAAFYCDVAGTWDTVLPGPVFTSAGASAAVAVQAETVFATNQFSIPANRLKAGTVLAVRGQGTVTTANGTLQIRVRLGGVGGVLVLDTGNAITPSNGDIFAFDLKLNVTDTGATGHVYGTFGWTIGTAGTGTLRTGKTASIAVDTTSAQNLVVTQQNGTGAGSITLDYLEVEIL